MFPHMLILEPGLVTTFPSLVLSHSLQLAALRIENFALPTIGITADGNRERFRNGGYERAREKREGKGTGQKEERRGHKEQASYHKKSPNGYACQGSRPDRLSKFNIEICGHVTQEICIAVSTSQRSKLMSEGTYFFKGAIDLLWRNRVMLGHIDSREVRKAAKEGDACNDPCALRHLADRHLCFTKFFNKRRFPLDLAEISRWTSPRLKKATLSVPNPV